MTTEVPETVKRETTKCHHDFRCPATGYCGHENKCEIAFAFGTNALALRFRERFSCPYHVSFGDMPLCTCPVRYYLYTKDPSNTDKQRR